MNIYKSIVFPRLCRMDPESAHDLAISQLMNSQESALGRLALKLVRGRVPSHPVKAFGVEFSNPIGIAAGFDKDVRVVSGLGALGFGHVEVGTLTPSPQKGNSRPRVFRLPECGAVINRMGFPNCGVEDAIPRLKTFYQQADRPIIGVSLGKQKETPLEEAAEDYKQVMRGVYAYADYLAVNISSPNTPGLRELQEVQFLESLLDELTTESCKLAAQADVNPTPLLVKIAPDLSWEELDEILAVISVNRIHGIIATNTTLSRDRVVGDTTNEEGGLSGRPLADRSNEIIRHIHKQTAGRLPIIGVGGVETVEDVKAKMDAGAALVQIYTGMVYEGPRIAGMILRNLT